MTDVENWLKEQKDTLESIVASRGREAFEYFRGFSHHEYEISACNEEFFQLSRGGDVYYDRYSVGWLYSTWYHLRRVNGLIKPLLSEWKSSEIKPDCVVDLGCGTGATLWAMGLICSAMKLSGNEMKNVRVINLDNSPFMLRYNKFLWTGFCATYPEAKDLHVEFSLRSWNTQKPLKVKDSWCFANYLFDAESDWEFLCDEFSRVAKKTNPSRLFLRSSIQKKRTIDRVAQFLVSNGYTSHPEEEQLFYHGPVHKIWNFRKEISRESKINLSGKPDWEPNRTGEYSLILRREAEQSDLKIDGFSIGRKPNEEISNISLNDKQKKIARYRPSPFPYNIQGPAGCGKSLVLVHAIKNLVENSKKINRVLLTTFNKELRGHLARWLEELLPEPEWSHKIPKEGQHLIESSSTGDSIEILHLDLIPTRVYGLEYHKIVSVEKDEELALKSIKEYCEEKNINRSSLPRSITPESLIRYYVRYYYGSEWKTLQQFEKGEMDRDLSVKIKTRAVLFDILKIYVKKFAIKDTFNTARDRCLKLAPSWKEREKKTYTYLFIDEVQDCSVSDIKILLSVIENPNCITIAGDFSQAVHLGKKGQQLLASLRKNDFLDSAMNRWTYDTLDGSYRLPYRISDCLKPLSTKLKENNKGNVIYSYPGGPPGARPILIKADKLEDCGNKIANMLFFYRYYTDDDKKRITIIEPDSGLSKAIRGGWTSIRKRLDPSQKKSGKGKFFLGIEEDTVLRIKGMEYPYVVWTTRSQPKTGSTETMEFAYTAMTRSSTVLIIAVLNEMPPENKEIIKLLDQNFVIPWDQESEDYMLSLNESE